LATAATFAVVGVVHGVDAGAVAHRGAILAGWARASGACAVLAAGWALDPAAAAVIIVGEYVLARAAATVANCVTPIPIVDYTGGVAGAAVVTIC